CIAPDYILIHESVKTEFLKEVKLQLKTFYNNNAETSESYGRIVNQKHFKRLTNHLDDAKTKNATIEIGGKFSEADNFIEPTVISNLSEDATLMQEEIFGPILPVKTYKTIDEVIDYINSKEKPLALYIFSTSKKQINHIINNTRAGSTCVNNNVLQYSNHHLPFGGSNNSGIGKSHGFYGFEEFSNKRSVLKQNFKGAMEMLFPPYTNLKKKMADLTIKWF